ncbi:G1 family glutamic endopeptidase [Alicyclobacillus ferrooxydans]|uniref:Peptidase A4 family protein n=1 Tax=Alicyclobacillus ferrooxydans TaxID=471514 RepID=A0A0P9CEQ6_9BACL|nr:G1 family glutamic endopeptidase [Alicyclobacillus ferrooxydans]KPV44298.1 hypothetical protein AN477_07790 [Alicyclobacillus ferrooxydans]
MRYAWKAKFLAVATMCFTTAGLIVPAYASSVSGTNLTKSSVRRNIPLATVKNLTDGSKQYIYYIDGVKNSFFIPPASFNPYTASNQDLLKYGYPSRPDKASLSATEYQSEMQDWSSFVSHHKSPTSYPQNIVVQSDTSNGQSSTTSSTNTSNSTQDSWYSNWSGYMATSSYNEWTIASGEFYQPSWTYLSSYPNAQESTWAGLGGAANSSSDLLQDGTAIDTGGQMVAWYEYLNSGYDSKQIDMPSVVVHTGDHIKAYVSYDSSTGTTLFDVIDYTDNTSSAAQLSNSSIYYDGRYAEFICERPKVGGSFTPLADFSQADFFEAQVYSIYNSWNQVGALNNEHIEMTSNGASTGTPLANAAITSSNTFWDSLVE